MTQMPLNDRDFAEIRANVMREIERRRTRNVWVAGTSFAFAVLALVFLLIPRAPSRSGVASAILPAISEIKAPAGLPAPHRAEDVVVATNTRPKKHHHHHRRPTPQTAIASAEPLTIELQTANPDVRIIWIAK